MPPTTTLGQLARKLAVPVEDVNAALKRLGAPATGSPHQVVPLDLAVRVREALAMQGGLPGAAEVQPARVPTSPRQAPSEESDLFGRAMAVAGVERMEGRDRSLPGAGKARAKKEKVPTRAAPVPMAPSGPATAPVGRTPPRAVPPPGDTVGAGRPPAVADASDGTAHKDEMGTHRSPLSVELARVVAERDALQRALGIGEQVRVDLERRLLEVSRERERLQESSAGGIGVAPGGVPGPQFHPISVALAGAGFAGGDEASRGVRAWFDASPADDLLNLLHLPVGFDLLESMESRVSRVCGRAGCEAIPGTSALLVPAGRCELCGGATAGRLLRRFSDACLLNGFTRVLVAGVPARYERWVRDGVDRRLQVRWLVGVEDLDTDIGAAECRWAHVVLVVDPEERSPSGVAASSTVLRIRAVGLPNVLLEATERIDRMGSEHRP